MAPVHRAEPVRLAHGALRAAGLLQGALPLPTVHRHQAEAQPPVPHEAALCVPLAKWCQVQRLVYALCLGPRWGREGGRE